MGFFSFRIYKVHLINSKSTLKTSQKKSGPNVQSNLMNYVTSLRRTKLRYIRNRYYFSVRNFLFMKRMKWLFNKKIYEFMRWLRKLNLERNELNYWRARKYVRRVAKIVGLLHVLHFHCSGTIFLLKIMFFLLDVFTFYFSFCSQLLLNLIVFLPILFTFTGIFIHLIFTSAMLQNFIREFISRMH